MKSNRSPKPHKIALGVGRLPRGGGVRLVPGSPAPARGSPRPGGVPESARLQGARGRRDATSGPTTGAPKPRTCVRGATGREVPPKPGRRLGPRGGRTGSASAGSGVSRVWPQTRWLSGKPPCPPACSQWRGPPAGPPARAPTGTPPPDAAEPASRPGPAPARAALRRRSRRDVGSRKAPPPAPRAPRPPPPTELLPRAAGPHNGRFRAAGRVPGELPLPTRGPGGGQAPRAGPRGRDLRVHRERARLRLRPGGEAADREPRAGAPGRRMRAGRGRAPGAPGGAGGRGQTTPVEGSGRGDLRGFWFFGRSSLKDWVPCSASPPPPRGWPDAALSPMSRLCTGSPARCGTWSSGPSAGCSTSCAPRKASTACRWTRRAGDGDRGSSRGGGCPGLRGTPHWPWPPHPVSSNTAPCDLDARRGLGQGHSEHAPALPWRPWRAAGLRAQL